MMTKQVLCIEIEIEAKRQKVDRFVEQYSVYVKSSTTISISYRNISF